MLILICLACSQAAWSESYQEGISRFNSLLKDSSRAQYRSHWLDLAEIFHQSYQQDPDGDQAVKSLYYIGRTYEELGRRSFLESDFKTAEDYYDRVIKDFPDHSWADDAQLRKAGIHMKHYQDPAQAYIEYLKVVYNFPEGDMRPKAQQALKELDQANLEKIQADPEDPEDPAPGKNEQDLVSADKNQDQKLDPPAAGPSDPAHKSRPEDSSLEVKKAPPALSGQARLNNIRHWSNDEYTRVVLDLDQPSDYFHKLLDPDPELGTPHRLFIDLDQTKVSTDTPREENISDGILKRIRSAQHTREKSRVVLDIQNLEDFRVFSLENPFRIVVDVYAPETRPRQTRITEAAPPRVDLDSSNKDMTAGSLIEQLGLKVSTIMIDPGHGGKDPGAVFNKILEKDLVLKMSRILGNMLKEQGFNVIYTRETDVFVPLEERTAMANSKKVDLFISIHANAHRSRSINGFEVYYLNFAQTKDAMRVAARENAVSTQKISDLQYILTDLMLNSKINESRYLARQIHGITYEHVRASYPGINDNGVRQAPFYVLMGARMPAILVEMGYMSNQNDLKLLRSENFMRRMASGLTRGIIAYKDKLEKFARLEEP